MRAAIEAVLGAEAAGERVGGVGARVVEDAHDRDAVGGVREAHDGEAEVARAAQCGSERDEVGDGAEIERRRGVQSTCVTVAGSSDASSRSKARATTAASVDSRVTMTA